MRRMEKGEENMWERVRRRGRREVENEEGLGVYELWK